MRYLPNKRLMAIALLLIIASLAPAAIPAAQSFDNNNIPSLPSPLCDGVQVPQGQRVTFHAYALGVQIYRWNGTAWVFVEPMATLYADAEYHEKVGIHYGGPTWEHNSGGKVIAARLEGCSPDTTAIPWLLLQTVTTDGPGPFSRVTYIHRVKTVGGLAPTAPGASIGAVAEVPYTAEYYFYRARN